MNIALVGSSGYISLFLLKQFAQESVIERVLKIDQTEDADVRLDLAYPEKFDYDLLMSIDYVIFTAAISSPDKCNQAFELCWNINVTGTKYFIQRALEYECRVLFFSSDAVFGQQGGYLFSEQSETKADTAYGKMKKEVEDTFKGNKNFKVMRLSYVVSLKDKFIKYCIDCIKTNKMAEVFHPFYRNCISVSDVVCVVLWFVKNWDSYEPFVLNVAGKELVSRVRIADELNRFLGNQLQYQIVYPGDSFYQSRAQITQMQSLYLTTYNILKDNYFSEKIEKELEILKNE